MCPRKYCFLYLFFLLVGLAVVTFTVPNIAYADEPCPPSKQGTCIKCHEDLYFLHDTGKWFCIREAPMACVDCHGGNATTLQKIVAHSNRSAYPIINEDVTRCQECHPEKSIERVQIFKDVAGVSPVMVAVAYAPLAAFSEAPVVAVTGEGKHYTSEVNRPAIAHLVLVTIAILLALALRFRRGKKSPL